MQTNESLSHVNTPSVTSFLDSVSRRTTRIGVIGLGYVGLPLCLVFVRAGFRVTGFDVDQTKVDSLNSGTSYIKHIGTASVTEAVQSGRLDAATDFDRLREMDAVIICVPTPLTQTREPDLSYVETTTREIKKRLRPGMLVVLESSTYPMTTEEVVLPILESSGIPCRQAAVGLAAAAASGGSASSGTPVSNQAYVAYSPEREDPGNKQFHTSVIPKLVGGVDEPSTQLAHALYAAAFESVIPVASARVAEMAKILENTYRCVNIALVNELKLLCQRMGMDIYDVIDAAATKPFGFHPFYPGPGLGGHCIPIDPFYLSWKAREFDFTTRFIELAGEINTEMPYRIVERVSEILNQHCKSVKGARILILGVAYKKDVDDMRESPSLKLIELFSQRGAGIQYHDPHIPHVPPTRHYSFTLDSVPLTEQTLRAADLVLIATDHSQVDYQFVLRHARLLVDTRNALRGVTAEHLHRC